MKLTGQKYKQLTDALLDAYPTPMKLAQMLRYRLDKNLNAIAGGSDLEEIIFNLIKTAESEGWTGDLIIGAHAYNPGNQLLQNFYQDYNQAQSINAPSNLQQQKHSEGPSQEDAKPPVNPPGPLNKTEYKLGHEQSSTPHRLRVFLCHSSNDKPTVRTLYQRLQAVGVAPWLDEEDLIPGQNWEYEIRKAIRACDLIIVCLSQGSITKTGFVQKEIKFALDVADEQPEGTIYLIPLKLESCPLPERLSQWHAVNFYEERGLERLMKALQSRAQSLGLPLLASPQRMQPPLVSANSTPYGGTLTLSDPLRDNSQGYGWVEDAPNSIDGFVFTGGAYHGSLEEGQYIACLGGPSFKDFAMEVQITILKGDCGGIIFRADNTGHHYLFEICPNGGYGVYVYFGPKGIDYKELHTGSSSAIRVGFNQVNLIAAVAVNQEIRLFVNRQLAYQMMDISYSMGQCGFAIDSSGAIVGTPAPTEVVFENLKVWTF